MSKKKRRASGYRAATPPSSRLLSRLSEAEAFIRDKQWEEAFELLESLDRRYPHRVEVLTTLANACFEVHDTHRYQHACERLLRIDPDNADAALGLAGAYTTNLRPALALRAFRHFLERWPDHERADDARKMLAGLEANMDDLLSDLGVSGEEGLAFAALHEALQGFLEQGSFADGRRVAEQLLNLRPDFAPALNNLSQIHFAEGHLDRAIPAAQRVLDLEPDNYHALSNLTRYLCLSGRPEEAGQCADRLKAITVKAEDLWLKKAEALSYLGEDQAVLDAFHGAERTGHLKSPHADPILYHLAAVAALRLGREDEARKRWKQALKLSPGLELAQANLDDLQQPVGKRHAPWAFQLPNWVSHQAIQDMAEQLTPAARRGQDQAVTRAARRYLSQHPEVAALVPLLLDRGGPDARPFALHLAQMAGTPEMLNALKGFALGQRGPDDLRHQAARTVSEAGLFPAGPTRMWINGEWHEILLMGFELHDDPPGRHRPRTLAFLIDAMSALQDGDGVEAERLLKQALKIEPDAPDLLNNLAAAYGLQGRPEEAEALLHQTHRRHPDYLFARVGLAQICLKRGEKDQARALLEPLFSRKRFHFSEFAAFCTAQIELFMAEGNRDAARSWLDTWAGSDPDNPNLDHYRRQLDRQNLRLWPFGRRT